MTDSPPRNLSGNAFGASTANQGLAGDAEGFDAILFGDSPATTASPGSVRPSYDGGDVKTELRGGRAA